MPPPPPKLHSIAPLPLSIRSWLLALGRLWGGGGFRRSEWRVERVTAWRGLNIWDGTDMLMYTTHLILFAKNIPCLQLSFRAGQIEYSHVISYFWLFARQRTHQAFVFYDNCQSVIPSLIWRLRALECFSSNLESDLSFQCCDKGPQNKGDECQAAKGKIEDEDYEPCGVKNPLLLSNSWEATWFVRLWLLITQA